MRTIRNIVFYSLLALSWPLQGQDLLSDGKRLMRALEVVQDTTLPESQRSGAAAEVLVILNLYDQPGMGQSPAHIDRSKLFEHLQGNELLKNLFSPRAGQFMLEHSNIDSIHIQHIWDTLQTPERQEFTRLMYEGVPLSPVEYLSVRQALANSAAPPLAPDATLLRQAEQSFRPPSVYQLRSEAILQGLFQFILDRSQQEIAVLYLEKLLDKRLPKVKPLFPNVAKQYRTGVVNYSSSFVDGLREAFFLDLKQLSITLPQLMLTDEYFGKLRSKPVYFNLVAIYNLYGLTQQQVELDEALPVTHRFLFQQYQNNRQALFHQLANNADTTDEYKRVIFNSQTYVNRLNLVLTNLLKVQKNIQDTIEHYRTVSTIRTLPPSRNQYLDNPLFDFKVIMGTAAKDSTSLSLDFLPDLLAGAYNPKKLVTYNTFEDFDRLFGQPRPPENMRVAGLELARNLNGSWYSDLTQTGILRRWQRALVDYERAVAAWKLKLDNPDTEQLTARANNARANLEQRIGDVYEYWKRFAPEHETQGLLLLRGIANEESFDNIDSDPFATPEQSLEQRLELLAGAAQRLRTFDDRMGVKYPAYAAGSPFLIPQAKAIVVFEGEKIAADIESLEAANAALQLSLDTLEIRHANLLRQTLKSAQPMVQLTEMASQMIYALKTPGGLITKTALDSAINDPKLRQVCLGLLQQRLSRVNGIGFVSPEGIAELITATLKDFATLRSEAVDTLKKPWYLSLYAAVTAVNRITSYPILPNQSVPGQYISLAQRNPQLSSLPTVSNWCMNFLYYLGDNEHRSAMGALNPMLAELSRQANEASTDSSSRLSMLAFFGDYGAFIAGLVDARTRQDVEYLLNTLADPPGSSRTKRHKSFSVGFNAYMAAVAGFEDWAIKENGETQHSGYYAMAAPNIPVGITLSKGFQIGKKRQSFGLHLGLLDLGSMLTYRFAPLNSYGGYKLTFKNVFKPSIQAHWNIPKSPFYFGTGWQMGGEFRELNGEEINLRSSRFFVGFGVDVTIKTLYSK